MAVDLGSIIRTLEAIEARHPDTRDDLTPIVAALTAADGVLLDVEEARRITGLPSAATVREWIRLVCWPPSRATRRAGGTSRWPKRCGCGRAGRRSAPSRAMN